MNFKKPLIMTEKPNLYHLAPIPVFQKNFHDPDFHKGVYDKWLTKLTADQKLMGQELPGKYDEERQSTFVPWTNLDDEWVETTEYNPIGSRFSVPPNSVLDSTEEDMKLIRQRIENGFFSLLDSLEIPHENKCLITESWMQYYNPYEGRGHNQHNHCRWHPSEEPLIGFSGGYYLSDGEPIKDHPYSGAFCFHVRGMSHFVRPKEGMLMMWPYDIVHSVKPFYGKKHRCVINFNIQLP